MFKKLILLVLVLTIFSGCAVYRNKAQYDKGDWYGITGSGEIARIEQDKLALEKLKDAPIIGDKVKGLLGIVANCDPRSTKNFKILGPEQKSFLILPGHYEEDNLIPGQYEGRIYHRGRQVENSWFFYVSTQKNKFLGKEYHWFLFYGDCKNFDFVQVAEKKEEPTASGTLPPASLVKNGNNK